MRTSLLFAIFFVLCGCFFAIPEVSRDDYPISSKLELPVSPAEFRLVQRSRSSSEPMNGSIMLMDSTNHKQRTAFENKSPGVLLFGDLEFNLIELPRDNLVLAILRSAEGEDDREFPVVPLRIEDGGWTVHVLNADESVLKRINSSNRQDEKALASLRQAVANSDRMLKMIQSEIGREMLATALAQIPKEDHSVFRLISSASIDLAASGRVGNWNLEKDAFTNRNVAILEAETDTGSLRFEFFCAEDGSLRNTLVNTSNIPFKDNFPDGVYDMSLVDIRFGKSPMVQFLMGYGRTDNVLWMADPSAQEFGGSMEIFGQTPRGMKKDATSVWLLNNLAKNDATLLRAYDVANNEVVATFKGKADIDPFLVQFSECLKAAK